MKSIYDLKAYKAADVLQPGHTRPCLGNVAISGEKLQKEGLAAVRGAWALYWVNTERVWEIIEVDGPAMRLVAEGSDGERCTESFDTSYQFYLGKPQGKFAPVEKEGGGG